MHDFDETDVEILSLLAEDARRPFSAIGDEVGLSGPAVSARVTRLEEAGIIEGFTVDVDRSVLRAGVPVFVRLSNDGDAVEDLRDRLADADGVEHVFVTAEGAVWFYGRAESQRVRQWVESLVGDIDYDVTLVDDTEWTPSLDGTSFAVTCVECGNTVDSEGESERIDGDIYHFCCPSCRSQFEERYERLSEGA
ncbi:AsnC family transcriptional regulator [Haloplanus sp. C73]|uniref:AsnC family transcriptional regulator n=1 Tax=Haloplanus sp. C73 TaxID=3421641 RepID=UPI003EBADBAF